MKHTKSILAVLIALALALALALPAMAEDAPVKPNISEHPQTIYTRAIFPFTLIPITFSVEASSPNGGTLSYQWYDETGPIAGATGSTLTVKASGEVGVVQYYVVVTNTYKGNAASVTSRHAQVVSFGGLIWTFGQFFTSLVNAPANMFSTVSWGFIGLIYSYVMMIVGWFTSANIGDMLPSLV